MDTDSGAQNIGAINNNQQEGTADMKIVIIHPKAWVRKSLVEWLEETRGHAVLADGDWPNDLRTVVAQYEPDLVLLPPATKSSALNPEIFVPLTFQECHFENLPDGRIFTDETPSVELEELLTEQERIYRTRQWSVRDYADDQRIIVHDEKYQSLASTQKLHVPSHEPGWGAVASNQEGRFLLQLQTAQMEDRHQRAEQYYRALQSFDEGLMQEVAYRLEHGSYKIAWLREHLARWLTVLSHYIPDAEIEHCPAPHNASTRVDFLHYEMPPVFGYAVSTVLIYGTNKSVALQIRDAASWRFGEQSETQLVTTACFLYGLNAYLAQVARAQIESVSQFLDPESPFHQTGMDTRNLRRTLGIFFEFWGWNYLWSLGDNIQEITRRFHSGETRVECPAGATMTPTFIQFRQMLMSKTHSLNS